MKNLCFARTFPQYLTASKLSLFEIVLREDVPYRGADGSRQADFSFDFGKSNKININADAVILSSTWFIQFLG